MDEHKKMLRALKQVELEFDIIIQKDRRNWLKVAKLLDTIEKQELYKVKARSFTEYVRELSKKSGVNISTLWRARSGARVFMEINNIPAIEEIDERTVKTTPEQLEMFGKVRTIAPEGIVENVKERLLKGEGMRHELKELWKIYRPLKGGQTERGRKPKVEEEEPAPQYEVPFSAKAVKVNKSIEENRYVQLMKDYQKMQRFHISDEDITEANIINALRTRRWVSLTLDQYEINKFNSFVNFFVDEHAVKNEEGMDLLALVRKDVEDKGKLPLVFGVTDVAHLDNLESFEAIQRNATFCNYYYVAVPMYHEHLKKALEILDESIGIIAVGEELQEDTKHELKIVRRSPYHEIEVEKKIQLFSSVSLRALGWD
ncbi:hypothetical protein [Algivirga pacifica]|uniref:Uncharacterized protein n=1 Tax=Algivirga pacifica TaxID=1162670 RepID=A0ABP9DLS6_9BACT